MTPLPEPLARLRDCGGYYECPRDAAGSRIGPLVGYAGRDECGRQYVGEVYVNFAQAERHPALLARFSAALRTAMTARGLAPATGFCGAPEGGKAFAYQLALDAGGQYIYPEKTRPPQPAGPREDSPLAFVRHAPNPGESWFIVEDVCNNFSTTAKLVALIEDHGATVSAVLCFFNRSTTVDHEYRPRPGLTLPVVAVIRRAFAQYRQDDPHVAHSVAAGDIVWSPKRDWPVLAKIGV